jgi:hypothetical protein
LRFVWRIPEKLVFVWRIPKKVVFVWHAKRKKAGIRLAKRENLGSPPHETPKPGIPATPNAETQDPCHAKRERAVDGLAGRRQLDNNQKVGTAPK